jgi:hypothetical protein
MPACKNDKNKHADGRVRVFSGKEPSPKGVFTFAFAFI